MVVIVSPILGLSLRPYTPADQTAVLRLIEADRLPGQPRPTAAMLAEALEGRSSVDAGWWAELEKPAVQVAVDSSETVVGVVSYAVRPKDGTGLLLWLHCREDARTADTLISHVLAELGPREVHAFHFASALSLGLEALPVRHRPTTATALEHAGFTGQRLWRYMRAPLPVDGLPRLADVRVGPEPGDKDAWHLEARQDDRTLAEAVIGTPVQGTGVLWWIGVLPDARRQGLGRAILGSALEVLAERDATEVILYVDDDAPPGDDRDRTAANSLYTSAGFEEVDRLYSYTHHGQQ